MIEVLVLVILSMLIGGVIVEHNGIKGLAIGIGGILIILALWFISHR